MTTLPDGCFDIGDDNLEDLSEGKRPYLGEDTTSYEETAHNQLLEDPKYAVFVHETQINRLIQVLDDLTKKVLDLESQLNTLEESMRFSEYSSTHNGPPEPPSGTDYGQQS